MTRLSSRSTRDTGVWANHRLARVIFSQSSWCRSVAIADVRKDTRFLMADHTSMHLAAFARSLVAKRRMTSFYLASPLCRVEFIHPLCSHLGAAHWHSMHLARSGIEQRDICRAPPRIHACGGLSRQNMHGRTREEVDGSCTLSPPNAAIPPSAWSGFE